MTGLFTADDIRSAEAEAGIIASLIRHPEYSFYSEELLPNHFTDKDNRLAYAAICDLARKDIFTIDPYNIISDLESQEATRRYASELTVAKLQEFFDMCDSIARNSIEEYKMLVQTVLDAAFRRDVVEKLDECRSLCLNLGEKDVIQRIYGIIDDVMMNYSVTEEVPEFKDVADDLWDEIEAHQDGKDVGAPFKFPTLNEYVTLEPGELVVLGAPAKGAKSMVMMNEAIDLLRMGKTVFYIDSELSSRLFLCRALSHLTGIEFNRIRRGRYDENERQVLVDAKDWLKNQRFVHLYMPIFDQQAIYTAVKKISHRFGTLDVLIVDYLKATGDADAYATYAELGKLTDLIKNDICGAMQVAGLAAAQLSATGKLADSAKISRNASTILLLTDKTAEEIEADGAECGTKKLIVSLNRNGMQHMQGEYIDIAFDGNSCTLTEAKQHTPVDAY